MDEVDYNKEFEKITDEIADFLLSNESRNKQSFLSTQSLIGTIYHLQLSIACSDSAILDIIAGDHESARKSRLKAGKARVEAMNYLSQWCRDQLGIEDDRA